MARRWLPLGLALLAAALDVSGSHGLAFHALLVAVPAAAVGAFGAFGELLDLRADDRAETPLYLLPLLSAMGLVLLVVTAAVRAPAIADAATPAIATNLLSLGLGPPLPGSAAGGLPRAAAGPRQSGNEFAASPARSMIG